MTDLRKEIWEHADGNPASPELTRALREQPALRAELEQARKATAALRQSLAGFKLDDARRQDLQLAIMDRLQPRVLVLWRVAAAAAAVVLVGGLMLWAATRGGLPANVETARQNNTPAPPPQNKAGTPHTDGKREPTPAPAHREWQVERFTPRPGMAEQVMKVEQPLQSGETLEVGPQEYARVSDKDAAWIAHPGSRVTAGRTLKLESGALELERGDAEVAAAGKRFAGSNFTLAVEGGALLIAFEEGTVTQWDESGEVRLAPGSHRRGEASAFRQIAPRAAYIKGMEAYRSDDWKAAREQLRVAALDSGLDTSMRQNAHFYWFAAAGRGMDAAGAVEIGEAYLGRFAAEANANYVRYFVGIYCVQLDKADKAREHLRIVAAGPAGQLRDLAQTALDALDGKAATGGQELWQRFYSQFRAREIAQAEATLKSLVRDFPNDPGVKNGDAAFQLFACAGNLGRLEDAIRLVDELLAAHPGYRSADYALYYKAMYQARLGRKPDALKTLDQLDKDHPESEMRKFAQPLRMQIEAK